MIIDMTKKIHEQITPDTWCKGSYFKDAKGGRWLTNTEDMVSACSLGWLEARYPTTIYDDEHSQHYTRLTMAIGSSLSLFNDASSTTFDDVVNVFKKLDI